MKLQPLSLLIPLIVPDHVFNWLTHVSQWGCVYRKTDYIQKTNNI